ncbi:tRNA-2-methylthio-N(6)-dimethylallyladenosine synthase [Phycisphaerae bacterium RAS1]|nr:tRNA-2-methylthio-N(6)-dimethylallyladenosine synthase [Phycisphaerae bacterium RAS1]
MGETTGRTYFLETFGCQMNILDSQLIEGQLRAFGLTPVASFSDADVVLFNTCSVRQHAEDKVLARLGQTRRHKLRRPETIVGVIGCMAEREKQGLFEKAPHVDLLCGPGELNRLPGLLAEVWERNEKVAALAGSLSRRTEVLQRAMEYDSLEALDLSRAPSLGEHVLQSYIRVQRGCDKFCTYCVVPFTRGPERSRPPQHIVDEAKMLSDRGCREVTLLGQTVNSYVHQEDGRPVPFAKLLERVHAVEGIDRVRFVTSFPADWDEDIFRVMRDCPRVMPYLHIPAQSGSDRMLKAMRRTYTVAEYLRLMDAARRHVPHMALAGDMIVGFCGETEEDFAATVELVRRVEYQSLFVFKYSPRPGTAADRNAADDVPAGLKAARNNELLAVQAEIGHRLRRAEVGRRVEVLVEGFSKHGRRELERAGSQGSGNGEQRIDRSAARGARVGTRMQRNITAAALQDSEQDRGSEISQRRSAQLVGRTRGDTMVVFNGDESLIGAIVEVEVTDATPLTLIGRVAEVCSPRRRPAPVPNSNDAPLPRHGVTPLSILATA